MHTSMPAMMGVLSRSPLRGSYSITHTPSRCRIPKIMGASGIMIMETMVTTMAAPSIFAPRRVLFRLSVQEIPHISMNATAKAGLMCVKKSNSFALKGWPNIYPSVKSPWSNTMQNTQKPRISSRVWMRLFSAKISPLSAFGLKDKRKYINIYYHNYNDYTSPLCGREVGIL